MTEDPAGLVVPLEPREQSHQDGEHDTVAAVNAETPASIILPSKYSPHSALYPSSSAASPRTSSTSVTLSLHTQSKHAIAALVLQRVARTRHPRAVGVVQRRG